jgi:hypothetical protein
MMATVKANFGQYKFTGTHQEFRKLIKDLMVLEELPTIPKHLQSIEPSKIILLYKLFKQNF